MDGSEPTAENTAINNQTIILPAETDKDVVLKVIAMKDNAKSEIATLPLTFRKERKVSLQISKTANRYDNADLVSVTASAEDAQIQYTLDYLDTEGNGRLQDVTTQGILAEKSISLPFVSYPDGGTLVLQTAAFVDGVAASPIMRQDFIFAKSNMDGFLVDGVSYNTFSDAVQAVEESTENYLYLQHDVDLGSEVLFPRKAVTIASTGSGVQFVLKADSAKLQGKTVFQNLLYDIGNLYANGYDVTVEDSVKAQFALLGHRIFAGGAYCEGENNTVTSEEESVQISVAGTGDYQMYGSGAMGTTLYAPKVFIQTAKDIRGKVARAFYQAISSANVFWNEGILEEDRQQEIGGGDGA